MRAAYYESNGPAREVLRVGEIETPQPAAGEVRVRLAVSGVNPSDVKSRVGLIGKMRYDRIVPHSDGAGVIDAVGDGGDAGDAGCWGTAWVACCGSRGRHASSAGKTSACPMLRSDNVQRKDHSAGRHPHPWP